MSLRPKLAGNALPSLHSPTGVQTNSQRPKNRMAGLLVCVTPSVSERLTQHVWLREIAAFGHRVRTTRVMTNGNAIFLLLGSISYDGLHAEVVAVSSHSGTFVHAPSNVSPTLCHTCARLARNT